MDDRLIFTVSDFVSVLNQTLEYAYPQVTIVGELANFKISKGKWLYFDLKDQQASVRFFGTIYALPGPLEEGMQLRVTGMPRLHPQFGFSVSVQYIQPVGEGTIKKAAELLKAKLQAEGLFDHDRKRPLPYPPTRIGLITSKESAAYADFIKIINARWPGMTIVLVDVQVQGEAAPAQISAAIEQLNARQELDAIVITRGGGSADDLQAFNTEIVVRAVAASRTPTLVAIGHEIDVSLAELAADQSASTPSNAAELLVPDRQVMIDQLKTDLDLRAKSLGAHFERLEQDVTLGLQRTKKIVDQTIYRAGEEVALLRQMVQGYDPKRILSRGYAWLKTEQGVVTTVGQLSPGAKIDLRLADGSASATVNNIERYTKGND